MNTIDSSQHARRHTRYQLDMPVRAVVGGGERPAVLRDISESGAAFDTDRALFTNDQFVELQVEGHKSITGRIVREFQGGYAMAFDEDETEKRDLVDDIEKFRALAGRDNYLEG